MEELKELEVQIQTADQLYWKKQNPQISDQEYDLLVRRLAKLDPENSLLKKVHSTVTSNDKVKHKTTMLSLAKVYTKDELISWCEKVARGVEEKFIVEIKYDGCSANYEDGVLATRGDGILGENITDKLPLIKMIISRFKDSKTRGEIVFRKSMFEKYRHILKKRDGTPYSNSRNACAGLLNRDDNPITEEILELVPFDMETTIKTLIDIKQFDFKNYIKEVQDLDYPADGLVISLADEEYSKSLGFTSHHPKGKMALKFANDSAETKLLGVTWSCGKEVITPIGNVEPIEIGGVTVSNVSLHNWDFITLHEIHIGDMLTIERAGDVIPHVVAHNFGGSVEITIDKCPECNEPVTYITPNIYCTNPNCIGKKVNKLYDAITRIGIDRIGKPTIRNMIDILGVDNLIDIFELTKRDLLKLPKFGERKASNTLNEIHKVNDEGVYEWQILAAMNIPGIGRTLSKTLCKEFGLTKLENICFQYKGEETLCKIEGIAEDRARDIVKGVKENIHYLTGLQNMLYLKFDEVEEEFDLPTVCFSGKFAEQKSVYYEKLKGRYEVAKSVTKSLDILVVADRTKGSSKQKKAEKLGIKILNIDEMMGRVK